MIPNRCPRITKQETGIKSYMKRKIIIAVLALFFAIILSLSFYIFATGPALPDETDTVIATVLTSPVPNLITGKQGYVTSGPVKIWYEEISPHGPPKGTVLLFMGISNDALGWPQNFLTTLVDSGYRVIRYDYRGTGLSDWVTKQYSLKDLADDAKNVLAALKIEKAHLVGISLGGMVAQEFALSYPEHTQSLVCMMSSGNIVDSTTPSIPKKTVADLIKISLKYETIKSEANTIKLHIAARTILKGTARCTINVRQVAEQVLFNIRNRKGYNPQASKLQQTATHMSGSRLEKLSRISIPTLVIHGRNDPLIPAEHSIKLARTIPHANLRILDDMGHDLPDDKIKDIGNLLTTFFQTARRS